MILLYTTLFVKFQVVMWMLFDNAHSVPLLARLESVNVIVYPVIIDVHF